VPVIYFSQITDIGVNMLSVFAIAPVIIAVFIFIIPLEKLARAIAIIAQAALLGYALNVFFMCKDADIVTSVGNYDGFLGIILKADTLTSVMLILSSFMFLIATVYSFNDKFSRLFWFFLFAWQGLLNGIFLSNDVFNVFVLMEVATVVVAALIMFKRDNRSMYDGMVYLMVNIVAMQFYLFGSGYIYKLTGTFDMTAAAQAAAGLDRTTLVLPFALIMTAISLKCALVPLFSWLPKAHGTPGAPPAVSALLSGLHIKSGVYLFIRFKDVFGGLKAPEFFLIIGIITGIIGFIFALSQTDIKLTLAYSTVSQIGLIMVGLCLDSSYSFSGSVYHIINHAFFKSALFLCAGIITHVYGTRDIHQIRGVFRRMPLVSVACFMAMLGITGAPIFNGSISKYFIMAGADRSVSAAMIFINLGTIITFIKFTSMFFGRAGQTAGPVHEADSAHAADIAPGGRERVDILKQAAVLVLGALCLAGGIFGEHFIRFFFGVEVSVDAAGYIEKTGLFAVSVIAGYFIYRYFVSRSPYFRRIRGIELSFRQICASIGGFFALTLIIARMMV